MGFRFQVSGHWPLVAGIWCRVSTSSSCSHSSSSSTPDARMFHKLTILDFEDENDDEDDFNKTELISSKHDICRLTPETLNVEILKPATRTA